MLGAGKYDDVCTKVRIKTQAKGAIVIVVDGNKGHGFSIQMPLPELLKLPDMLEYMAGQIRQDLQNKKWAHNGDLKTN